MCRGSEEGEFVLNSEKLREIWQCLDYRARGEDAGDGAL